MVLYVVLSQFRVRIALSSAPISLTTRKIHLTPLETNHCAKRNDKSHRIKSLRKNHRGGGAFQIKSASKARDFRGGSRRTAPVLGGESGLQKVTSRQSPGGRAGISPWR